MNMDTFDKYKYLLGETIMLYQLMENDLRLMFAGMIEFYAILGLIISIMLAGQVGSAITAMMALA